MVLVSGNHVHDLSSGISATGYVDVYDNTVWGNSTGIGIGSNAAAHSNEVFNNSTGIVLTYGGWAYDNEVYGNSTRGISSYAAVIESNLVYSNPVGINDTGSNRIINNVIWDNTTTGIYMTSDRSISGIDPDGVYNNTIRQAAGTAIRVENATNVIIRNNIIDISGGCGVSVTDGSEVGFASDYNLFHLSGTATLASWEGDTYSALSDWRFETGFDVHSVTAEPLYVDADGSDDISGFSAAPAGSAIFLDDGDAGVTYTGSWPTVASGYLGDHREGGTAYVTGTGQNTVTYTFTDLTP
jgi:hypothetical protein